MVPCGSVQHLHGWALLAEHHLLEALKEHPFVFEIEILDFHLHIYLFIKYLFIIHLLKFQHKIRDLLYPPWPTSEEMTIGVLLLQTAHPNAALPRPPPPQRISS